MWMCVVLSSLAAFLGFVLSGDSTIFTWDCRRQWTLSRLKFVAPLLPPVSTTTKQAHEWRVFSIFSPFSFCCFWCFELHSPPKQRPAFASQPASAWRHAATSPLLLRMRADSERTFNPETWTLTKWPPLACIGWHQAKQQGEWIWQRPFPPRHVSTVSTLREKKNISVVVNCALIQFSCQRIVSGYLPQSQDNTASFMRGKRQRTVGLGWNPRPGCRPGKRGLVRKNFVFCCKSSAHMFSVFGTAEQQVDA